MPTASVTDALARWPLPGGLPSDFVEVLAARARMLALAPGEFLFREGSDNGELFVVAAGSLGLDMQVPGRGQTRILTLGPGDLVAWSAILGDGRMTTSAVALEPAELVALPAAYVLELCEAQPALGYRFMRGVAQAISRRLVGTRLQLLDLFSNSSPASRV